MAHAAADIDSCHCSLCQLHLHGSRLQPSLPDGPLVDLSSKVPWTFVLHGNPCCLQDAVVKGWFRTSRLPTHGGTHLRTVALTAYEVASAMAYIHAQEVLHLVRGGCSQLWSDLMVALMALFPVSCNVCIACQGIA